VDERLLHRAITRPNLGAAPADAVKWAGAAAAGGRAAPSWRYAELLRQRGSLLGFVGAAGAARAAAAVSVGAGPAGAGPAGAGVRVGAPANAAAAAGSVPGTAGEGKLALLRSVLGADRLGRSGVVKCPWRFS
jgi:hypothetical protein